MGYILNILKVTKEYYIVSNLPLNNWEKDIKRIIKELYPAIVIDNSIINTKPRLTRMCKIKKLIGNQSEL